MQQKIKNLKTYADKYQLLDIRTIGLIIFGGIVLIVSFNGSKTIQLNYTLQKQTNELTEQNKIQELENESIGLTNEYYKTSEFRELSARRIYGKAAPGETVYVIPKEIALKHTKTPPISNLDAKTEPQQVNPVKKSNWQQNSEAWIDFFLHRQNI
jgi:cell division protein FtsB